LADSVFKAPQEKRHAVGSDMIRSRIVRGPAAHLGGRGSTRDGRLLTGLLHQDSSSTLTLQTVAGDVTVDKREVARTGRPDASMMPEGLLSGLGDREAQDLLRYLRSSRQVPLPTPAAAKH
jgi:hypothetical protein